MQIEKLSPEMALELWPIISPILARAQQYGQGETTMTDYMRKILSNAAQCWVIVEGTEITAAGLTEVIKYATHDTVHIILFAGKEEHIVHIYPTVEQWGREIGCKRVEQWGRPGWSKLLPKHVPGFEVAYVVMRKNINEEETN